MTLRERIEATPARVTVLALGGCFVLSCITLLGDGFDHLLYFLPLAALNTAIGAFSSERVARVVLLFEACASFGLLASTLFQIHERFPNT